MLKTLHSEEYPSVFHTSSKILSGMKGKMAVYCSASFNIDPKYNKVARDFVRAASLRGYGIVTGGTVKGTMVKFLMNWLPWEAGILE